MPDFKNIRILIFDDDTYLAKIMRSILEAFDVCHVSMVTTYDDAITAVNNQKFNCIFVDNMTSEQDGLQLAKFIRRSDDTKLQAIPIILYTAFTGLQSILNARDAGITEVLAKPISPEQIMEKMSNALFNKRPFIVSQAYFGPDRRRRIRDMDETIERRKSDISATDENKTGHDDQGEGE